MSWGLRDPVFRAVRDAWRGRGWEAGSRTIPEESAVALTYNSVTHAVMMATPRDLEDFAVGFSLSEQVVASADDIETIEIVPTDHGIELRLWIAAPRSDAFIDRRRFLAGPTGCGLCGIESLAEAVRTPPVVTRGLSISPQSIAAALASLPAAQVLNQQTRAVHAAAFWEPGRGLVALREDVGRHNALDKLAGALARAGTSAARGVVLLTSRVSVELVQKAAVMGAPVIVAVSAPTALAVRTAKAAGITLVAVARDDGFELFANPHRIVMDCSEHVA
ncbi:MAG TPA: formate dehydrogenase accessory sulfurtransferase FdhD [Stellaceae bacterium]|jgi:FdhD protein|nr:formate dehydrogenase accessory sulfurtransferase FdhD [Stellaceae bacterium]